MTITTNSLGSSPLGAVHQDDGGNPLFVATPRRAGLTNEQRRGAVAQCAITYAADLRALADRLPVDDEGRARLESLLYAVEQVQR